ncbi:MAG TPA: hypothetical protein PK233_06725 [Candidatus Atribacteria bacterium]|nr:hypothetical protein [Candidatus Atribacteria bacterium]
MVGMSTIVYKSFSNKSDDTIDSIILHFLKQGKLRYNSPYLGFDSSEREEAAKEKIVEYELLSLKKNKTSRDHLKLLRTSIELLRDSETRNEKRWWYSEAIHHFRSLEECVKVM